MVSAQTIGRDQDKAGHAGVGHLRHLVGVSRAIRCQIGRGHNRHIPGSLHCSLGQGQPFVQLEPVHLAAAADREQPMGSVAQLPIDILVVGGPVDATVREKGREQQGENAFETIHSFAFFDCSTLG